MEREEVVVVFSTMTTTTSSKAVESSSFTSFTSSGRSFREDVVGLATPLSFVVTRTARNAERNNNTKEKGAQSHIYLGFQRKK